MNKNSIGREIRISYSFWSASNFLLRQIHCCQVSIYTTHRTIICSIVLTFTNTCGIETACFHPCLFVWLILLSLLILCSVLLTFSSFCWLFCFFMYCRCIINLRFIYNIDIFRLLKSSMILKSTDI